MHTYIHTCILTYTRTNTQILLKLLQRACIYTCSQEWDLAMADLNTILYYQPGQHQAMTLRARTFKVSE